FRTQPELYRVGKGEQGVLLSEPYKSEIPPHWRFRTPEIARESADAIFAMFEPYRADEDFVGMDMARISLHIGRTRARRYANQKDGRRYDAAGHERPRTADQEESAATAEFYERYAQARNDPEYEARKREWVERFG